MSQIWLPHSEPVTSRHGLRCFGRIENTAVSQQVRKHGILFVRITAGFLEASKAYLRRMMCLLGYFLDRVFQDHSQTFHSTTANGMQSIEAPMDLVFHGSTDSIAHAFASAIVAHIKPDDLSIRMCEISIRT